MCCICNTLSTGSVFFHSDLSFSLSEKIVCILKKLKIIFCEQFLIDKALHHKVIKVTNTILNLTVILLIIRYIHFDRHKYLKISLHMA